MKLETPDVYIQVGEYTLGFRFGELFSVSHVEGQWMELKEAKQKKLASKIEKAITEFWIEEGKR